MRIQELAAKTGVSVRSLRYYETKQLLSPLRLPNGYRNYDDTAVNTVRMIQAYLQLGLGTEEIARIIHCEQRPLCREAYELYRRRLDLVEAQLAALNQIKFNPEQQLHAFERSSVDSASNAEPSGAVLP